jgi:hypothetical protein
MTVLLITSVMPNAFETIPCYIISEPLIKVLMMTVLTN